MQNKVNRARSLRQQQTKAESLLWTALRNRKFCHLKFRRQFPVGPFFADFACKEKDLIVEVDGGYHDYRETNDRKRQTVLETAGWKVIRFSNEDVVQDVEAILMSLARMMNLEREFTQLLRGESLKQ